MNIEKGVEKVVRKTEVSIVMILVGMGCFFLGGLITYTLLEKDQQFFISNFTKEEISDDLLSSVDLGEGTGLGIPTSYGGSAVYASKNGTRYYPANCTAGMGRIKPENLVWYASAQHAQFEGLQIAVACKNK